MVAHPLQICTSSLVASICSSLCTCSSVSPGMLKYALEFNELILMPFLSTGSAGLIQTIRLFAQHHWVPAIIGTIATVGWTIQGLGNAFYYRSVRLRYGIYISCGSNSSPRSGNITMPLVIPWKRFVAIIFHKTRTDAPDCRPRPSSRLMVQRRTSRAGNLCMRTVWRTKICDPYCGTLECYCTNQSYFCVSFRDFDITYPVVRSMLFMVRLRPDGNMCFRDRT
jgi:hypothetical protein